MTSRTWVIQLMGALLIIILLAYSIPILTQKINTKMAQYVQETLHKQGYSWVSITAKGRHIIINGQTDDVQVHQSVLNQVSNLWFVKSISNKITPIIIKPYILNLFWDNFRLSVDGYLNNQQSHEKFKQYLQQHFSGKKVEENLKLAVGMPKQWQALAQVLLQHIKGLSLASVQMVGHNIKIQGQAQKTEQVTALEKAIKPFKKYNYQFVTQIIALDQSALHCQEKFNTLLKTNNIMFKTGGSIIDNSSDSLLSELVKTAVFCENSTILIVGHTDNVGDELSNLKLSKQRAEAVKGRLFSQGGIPLNRLKVEGKGSSEPLDSNETKQGQANNRRIEFILEGL